MKVGIIVAGFLLVNFEYNSRMLRGSINIRELSHDFITDIFSFADIGDEFVAKVIDYDEYHQRWRLTLK